MYMRSLWNGVSGVKSFSAAMQSVADNLSNANTVGYKTTRATFEDLLYSNMASGAGDLLQVGNGSVAGYQNMMLQGSMEDTDNPLDMAISGNGFFILEDPLAEGNLMYSRAGQFIVNDESYLVNPEGFQLQGYTATNGVIDEGNLGDLLIDTSLLPGISTSNVDLGINLNAEDSTIFPQSMDIDPLDQTTYNTALSFNVYDADFNQREMRIYFQRVGATSTGAVWKAEVYENQGGVAVANPPEPNNAFYMQFDGDGQLVGTAQTAAIDQGDIWLSNESFTGVGNNVSDRAGETFSYTANGVTHDFHTSGSLYFTSPSSAGDQVTIGGDIYTSAGTASNEEAATELAAAINSNPSLSYYAMDDGNGGLTIHSKSGGAIDMSSSGGVIVDDDITMAALISDMNEGGVATGVVHLNDLSAAGSSVTLAGVHTFTINTAATLEDQAADLANDINLHPDYIAEAHGGSVYITYNELGLAGNVGLETSDAGGNVLLSGASLANGRDSSSETGVTVESYENVDGTWSMRLLHNETGADASITLGANTLGAGLGLDLSSFTQTGEAADGVPIEANEATQSFDFVFDYAAVDPDTGDITTSTTSQTVAVDFIPEGSTSTTMQAGSYSVFFVDGDGEGSGYLTSVEVDRYGVITGYYNNGRKQTMAQVALSTFVSPEDMQRYGDNLWKATAASGEPVVAAPGDTDTGMGLVFGGALEISTVDMAQEMVNMIEYQRAFQASSKAISTSDDILKVAINLKS